MNINKVTQFNNGFVGVSSHKPIVGHIAYSAFANVISQGKNNGDEVIVAGQALKVTTNSADAGAGEGLNPNVFLVSKLATGETLGGFALKSENDIVSNDYPAGVAFNSQIIYIGLLGSGVETYLPVASASANFSGDVDLSKKLTWNGDGVDISDSGTISILSNVIDGVKAKADGSGFETCKVIKVKL